MNNTNHQYDYFFFDLDGTLTDPAVGITASVAYSLEKFGIHIEDRTQLYSFIGPPLRYSYPKFFGFGPEKTEQAIIYYRERFSTIGLFENEVYEGVPETLEALLAAGKKLVIATSKPDVFTLKILDHFHLSEYFCFVACSTLDGSREKKEDVIAYAISSLGITDPSRVLMIGDRGVDMKGAHANGIRAVGASYGYGDPGELEKAGAEYIIDSIYQLKDFI